MPKMIAYGMLCTNKNAIAGHLVKASCSFCGAKYGSEEEAKKCEAKHNNKLLRGKTV